MNHFNDIFFSVGENSRPTSISAGLYYEHWEADFKANFGCNEGGYIYVADAQYYAPTMWLCWKSDTASSRTRTRCDSHQTCTLPTLNDFFGDPCWGIPKIFKVWYHCQSCVQNQYFVDGSGCTDCPGTEVSEAGTPTSCSPEPCQPANYMDSGVCTPCSEGFWSAGQLAGECTKCPEGKTVEAGAGGAEEDCVWECQCETIGSNFYECIDTTYDVTTSSVTAMQPTDAGDITVSAVGSSKDQSATLTISEEVSETSSFSHTAGASITVGAEFEAGIPLIAASTVTTEVSASYEFSTGEDRTETKTMTAEFPCVAAAGSTTVCKALIFKYLATVPYTQTWQHKYIGSSCQCQTSGVFEEIAASKLEFYINEVEAFSVAGEGGFEGNFKE